MNTFYNIFSDRSFLQREADIEEGLPLLSQGKQPIGCFQGRVCWEGEDLSIHIFDFLPPPHLIHTIGLVCKKWRQLSSHSFLLWNKFLPHHFVTHQQEHDYRQTYLDWLAMGSQFEDEAFTSKRIVSPFGGFITTMATLPNCLILGSNLGFISIIDTKKTKLLSSTHAQMDHAIQYLDASGDLLAFATIEKKGLEREEQYFKRLVHPSFYKGTLQFWHSGTLTQENVIEFDHTVKSIKIHSFEGKMGKHTLVAVQDSDNHLFIFDRTGQLLDSQEQVSSFCFNEDELFLIRSENGERFMVYYHLKPGETAYLIEKKKQKIHLPSVTIGMNTATKKLFFHSNSTFYEIDRKDWVEDRLGDLKAISMRNIKKIVHFSLTRKIALTKMGESDVFSYALTFFNAKKVEAIGYVYNYHFNFDPLVAVADKKIYILGSRDPVQRCDETIALDCYDLTSPNYLAQLASKINWMTGKRSFFSYLLSERKWAAFGIPILMGQAILGLTGTSVIGSQHLVPSKLLYTIQFVHLLTSGLLMLAYPSSIHRIYQEDRPASTGLIVGMMLLPMALLTSHQVNWDQARFLEMFNSFMLWRIKKIRKSNQPESRLPQHSYTDSVQARCPISRLPIIDPIESNGVWFEKSLRLEFLEYARMISGEGAEADFEP